MAKKVKEEKQGIDAVLEALENKYGMQRAPLTDMTIVSTGSIQLNRAMGIGGTALGKIIELHGEESCLSGETFISYDVFKNGKCINSKGGTLLRLWERFNKIVYKKPGWQFIDYDVDYFVKSKDENNVIIGNKVLAVIKTGIKPVYKLTTKSGFEIKTTEDHKFCTLNDVYVELKDLKIGDIIVTHPNKRVHGRKKNIWRKDVMVKNYPNNRIKIVTEKATGIEYKYKRFPLSHLYYEAYLNNLAIENWRNILNSDNPNFSEYKFIPKGFEIHHKDEIPTNNSIDNLVLLTASDHGKLHAKERIKNLSFITDTDEIISIEYSGEEDTFDIKCGDPYHNFVANKIVVHNCGKTTCSLHQMAEYQKAFPNKKVALLDFENSFDKKYAEAIGVDVSKLLIYQPDNQEIGYNMAISLIEKDIVSCIVIDSQSAAAPKAIIDGEMGDSTIGLQARNNSKFCMKVKGLLNIHQATLFIISQTRSNIGGYDPTVITGGKAFKFYADARWKVWKMNDKEHELNKTTIDVIKNKMGNPFGQAKINILWGIGFDKIGEIVEYACDFKIIQKGAAGWFTIEGQKVQGLEKMRELLNDNPELFDEIERKVFEQLSAVPEELDLETIIEPEGNE